MIEKKGETRFTIYLSNTDPSHIKVSSILSQQGRRKTQYMVNAILHYINCYEIQNAQHSAQFDEKAIESIVNRILKEREGSGASKPAGTTLVRQDENPVLQEYEIDFDNAMRALETNEGLNAVANALEMFRKK